MNGSLEYWRADNMWAAEGRPDGPLGKESISLPMGATQVFFTTLLRSPSPRLDFDPGTTARDGRNLDRTGVTLAFTAMRSPTSFEVK